jgi:hypothetical protein
MITICPYCGAQHDGITSLEADSDPNPGDYDICVSCGRVSVFCGRTADRYLLRKPTPEEALGKALIQIELQSVNFIANYKNETIRSDSN